MTPKMALNIALTMGDPAGIGPEITNAALTQLGDWLDREQIRITYFGAEQLVDPHPSLDVQPLPLNQTLIPGSGNSANGAAVIRSIELAVAGCMDGTFDAVVTNPINKAVLYDAGFKHPGHTEFLADLCGCVRPTVMMLASDQMSVVPITLHTSLARAIDDIRKHGAELITHAALTTAQTLREQGIQRPRLAVSGLNPHAGEGGAMGDEEIEIIAPVVKALSARNDFEIIGPLPADTMFDVHNRQRYDVALAMTHDQALIPIKTLAFDEAVNITMGLPIVRTSPDHGTAYDIAGKGLARPNSLIAAIKKAAQMARQRKKIA